MYVAHVAHVSSVRRVRVSQVSGTGASRPLDTVLMPGGGGGGWAVFHLKTAAAGAAGRQPLALSLTEEGADGQWQQMNVSRRGHHHNRQPHLVLYSRDNRTTHHQTVNGERLQSASKAGSFWGRNPFQCLYSTYQMTPPPSVKLDRYPLCDKQNNYA